MSIANCVSLGTCAVAGEVLVNHVEVQGQALQCTHLSLPWRTWAHSKQQKPIHDTVRDWMSHLRNQLLIYSIYTANKQSVCALMQHDTQWYMAKKCPLQQLGHAGVQINVSLWLYEKTHFSVCLFLFNSSYSRFDLESVIHTDRLFAHF